jgi:hypothetical protein
MRIGFSLLDISGVNKKSISIEVVATGHFIQDLVLFKVARGIAIG